MPDERGFTLIELLMVIVVLGILVAVAIPRWSSTRDLALQAAMKSDLRNLVTAEESYFLDHDTYTSALAELSAFQATSGVVVSINEATTGGWSATASHPGASKHCYLYVGNVSPIGGAVAERSVVCN